MLIFTLGRGAITWIALQPAENAVSVRSALRAAWDRFPALAASTLLYGALIGIGLYAVSIGLREFDLDTSNYRWLRLNDASGIRTAIAVQSLSVLQPDPGAPFSEVAAIWRYTVGRYGASTNEALAIMYGSRGSSPQPVVIGLVGTAWLIATEALLCLRSAVVMADARQGRTWLRQCLSLSFGAFGRIVAWRWGLRLLLAALTIAGIVLPTLMQQAVLVPLVVRETRSYWTYPVSITLYTATSALVSALLITFEIVYETRLFVKLRSAASQGSSGA
jgi:hypothetical protein